MKKNRLTASLRLLLCALVLVTLLVPAGLCFAADDGYYIKNMQVDVTANTDRSFDIVETIDVHFNESRHGIIRNIPTNSSLEREIRLENVSVEGALYTYDGYGTIKIGDPDKTVRGDMQYVIRYTLWHYADSEPDYDYLYLNLIGTEWDTRIDNYTATVRLPAQAEINDITLTAGTYGSTASDNVHYSQSGNTITVTGGGLAAYEGVTINVEMLEGAFPDAQVWQPPLVFHNIKTEAVMDKYAVMHVVQTYNVTVNEGTSYSIWQTHSGETAESRVKNIVVTYPDGRKEKYNTNGSFCSVYLDASGGRPVTFTIEFDKMYDVTAGAGSLNVQQIVYEGNKDYVVERIEAVFDFPFAVQAVAAQQFPDVSYRYYDFSEDEYTVRNNGGRVEVVFDPYTKPGDNVHICVRMPETYFLRKTGAMDVIAPLLSALCLAAVAYFAFTKRGRQLNPVPEFYPPEGINPAEIGYIIDEKIDRQDVISLIYYWASKKLLRIKMEARRKFTLVKTGSMDATYRSYERSMFNGLWSCGRQVDGTVTNKQLENKFYTHVDSAVAAIRKQFTGVNALSVKSRSTMAWLTGALAPVVCAVIGVVAISARGFGAVFQTMNIMLVVFIDWTLYFSAALFQQEQHKSGVTVGRIVRVVWFLARFGLAVGICLKLLTGKALPALGAVVFALGMNLIPVVAPFIKRRTQVGETLLERTLGFKQFLETAEKERLRMLLDENPDYYYDILPYAQVLGVSKQWTNKLNDMISEPPSWMESNSSGLPAYLALNTLSSSMRSSMTSTPSSDGGGGSSGGGGGGSFSGGGFSGGGSGGGGGSSW